MKSANVMDRNMQDCFRAHPDIYGAELEDDEEGQEEGQEEGESGSRPPVDASPEAASSAASTPSPLPTPVSEPETIPSPAPVANREDLAPSSKTERAKAAAEQVKRDHIPTSESEKLVPRASHDAR